MDLDAFEVFPKKVWLAIIDGVVDGETWLNLSNTCSSLQELMEPRKVFGLLPLILVPVSSYLDKDDLLKSRLVSRRWKSAVDHLVKYGINLEIESNLIGRLQGIFEHLEFFTSTKIQEFLLDMSTNTGNPFVVRAISLVCGKKLYVEDAEGELVEVEPAEVFWDAAKQLLQRFGKHIHSIILRSVGTENQNEQEIANHLLSLLTLTPGLRTLQIETKNENDSDIALEINLDDIKPVFRHLKSINLFQVATSTTTKLWLEAIHKMCYHPGKVVRLCVMNDLPPNLKIMFPNLEIIDKCQLYILPADRGIAVKFQETISCFQQFAETLTTLMLRSNLLVEKSLMKNVNLPNLKRLYFRKIVCDTLDFLKQFDSLEEMEIPIMEFHRPHENSVKNYYYEDAFFDAEKKDNSYQTLPLEVKIFPYVSKFLEKTDFPRLRLVSLAWKQAVDRVAEHEQLFMNTGNRRSFPFQEYKFSRAAELRDFLEKMNSHPGNPFVGRNVKICLGYSLENSREFRNMVLQLLERFGREIIKLSWIDRNGVEYDENSGEYEVSSIRLMNALKLTPNLKVLTVEAAWEMNNAESSDIIVPTLQHLQTLSVTGSQHLHRNVHRMCCYPDRVTNLAVNGMYSPELAAMFPNVERFSACFYGWSDFAALKNSGWRLKTLICGRGYVVLKLNEVVPHIQNFKETLTRLSFQNGILIDGSVHLGLFHLKELKFHGCQTSSLEVFSELTELTKMKIDFFHFQRQGKFNSS